ncbi:universal stress protein [Asanoa iriomotensis]|uniref:Universal stress protein n=1 Tax=Asanoa iriomotensis TaxID=234613 RepID=A0ABQ4CCN1_9ACTN|nr:universal stress protein [Asanoa iriomotensis]GIF60524.1 universal stress protein [Asanoa iriomotensis]
MGFTVVAGVDGSPASLAAARYAAGVAARRAGSLTLVHGFIDPLGYGVLGPMALPVASPDPGADGEVLLADAVELVAADFPRLTIRTILAPDSGTTALIDQSRKADLVVVGHRGMGGFPELLLGSVGAQVVAYAHCPVVVHRPTVDLPADAPVVVGVDGAEGADAVVGFAFDEAAARGLPLNAVHVYLSVDEGSAARAEGVLNAAVAPWEARRPGVRVRRDARGVRLDEPAWGWHTGPTASAEAIFVAASRRSALVVVGARGRGGFSGLLLGSVSQALVHHAHCPVAVVRDEEPTGPEKT